MENEVYVAVDLGATNLRVGIGKEKILEKISKPTPKTPNKIIQQLKEMIENLVRKHKAKLNGIGIASIGPMDIKRGIIFPPNLPFKKLNLVKPLKEFFKVKVVLIGDCTAAVLAEQKFGAGKGIKNLVYVTLSTGIGGGAIVDNHLLFGKDGSATHIGHLVIDYEKRLKCGCGKYGHWEAYCSGANIPNFVRFLSKKIDMKKSLLFKVSKGLKKLNSKMVFDCAKSGDKISKRIVDEIGRLNAIGIANVINAYDPELITIGGSITLNNKQLVLKPIKKYVKNYVVNRIPKIKITPLGEDIGLLGALIVAKSKIIS
jgi:glucokinase